LDDLLWLHKELEFDAQKKQQARDGTSNVECANVSTIFNFHLLSLGAIPLDWTDA
jgi:hypothetical protein